MRLCMSACVLHACMCVLTDAIMYLLRRACMRVRIYVCVCACTFGCMYVCMHACVYVYAHV